MESTTLKETAGLARIPLDEGELQELAPAFERMLSLLDEMRAACGDKTLPAAESQADFVLSLEKPVRSDFLRPDAAQDGDQKETNEFMLSQAPERDGNFIVIPNVL